MEKIAPAMAVPATEMVAGFEVVRDLGRFWTARIEICLLGIGFKGLMHLALSIAMVVDRVAAIGGGGGCGGDWWLLKMKFFGDTEEGRWVKLGI